MKPNTWRSIAAVAAGLVAIVVVTTAIDVLLHLIGVFPPMDRPIDDSLAILATAYRIVVSVAGAYLTARLAPDQPMFHALVLGGLGLVLGGVGAVATWNLGLGPRWYPVALALLAIPQCWLGGWLHQRRRTG